MFRKFEAIPVSKHKICFAAKINKNYCHRVCISFKLVNILLDTWIY